MTIILELLGKGLKTPLMRLVLPQSRSLCAVEAALLEQQAEETNNLANLIRVGIHYAENGAIDKARNVFDKVLQADPGNAETHLAMAAIALWDADIDQAIEILTKAVSFHPEEARLQYALGYCHERVGAYDQAIPFYEKAAGLRPYLRTNRERLAAIYVYKAEYENALNQCRQLVNEHPGDMWLYLAMGQLFLHLNRFGDAAKAFERGLTIEPDNFELKDDDVESLIDSGDYDSAIESINETIARQGDFPDNYVRLADLYVKTGADQAAVTNYNKALELHPGYLEAAVKLGTQHLRHKRYYDAAVNFSRAVEINDQLITAYIGLAVAQMTDGYPEQARETVALAAALEPNTNLLFSETCRLQLKIALARESASPLYEFETPEPATNAEDLLNTQLERHQQALAVNGNQADLHYRYGMLLRGMGRVEEAAASFQNALKINNSYCKAKIKLGLCLREMGQLKEGMQELCQSMALLPEYVNLHYKLGLLYCDKIRFALAVEHFENSFEMGNDPAEIQANLRLALQNMGLIDRVSALWRAVCELQPDSTMAFQSQRIVSPLNPVY